MEQETLTKEDLRWFERYYELREFKNKFGHTRVPEGKEDYFHLGHWVHYMRKRRDNLETWKTTMLNALRFQWVVRHVKPPVPLLKRDPAAFGKVKSAIRKKLIITTEDPQTFTLPDYQWYYMLLELIRFKKQAGHTSVPNTWKDKVLAHWVMKQRKQKSKLREERVKALDAIGFVWRIYDITRTPWETRFAELIAYKKEFGHINVPQKYGNLGRWVWMQRRYRDKMPEERKKLLSQLGFTWEFNTRMLRVKRINQRTDKQWQTRFEELREYKKVSGHCNIQPYWKENLFLARWVARQRVQYWNGLLPEDRFFSLDALGFVWDSNKVYRLREPNHRKVKKRSTEYLRSLLPG